MAFNVAKLQKMALLTLISFSAVLAQYDVAENEYGQLFHLVPLQRIRRYVNLTIQIIRFIYNI